MSTCKAMIGALAWLALTGQPSFADDPPTLAEIRITSSVDGTSQPARFWAPEADGPRPLLVFLHSWSGDYTQDRADWVAEAQTRGWIYVQPNFRGRNDHPEACGSELARGDILDAVDWVLARHQVDRSQIYLAGVSGGGHMSMLMAGRHAERFSAVSAWVGISELADWYRFHTKDGEIGRYARMAEACCGGPPGASEEVDRQYRERSPIYWLDKVEDLHLDINAGVMDGKTGSVPIHQSLRAFNAVAQSLDAPTISDAEIEQLWSSGRLEQPRDSDLAVDATYGRQLRLRRFAGETRVTIFDGGHEGLTHAACEWLSQQSRMTKAAGPEQ